VYPLFFSAGLYLQDTNGKPFLSSRCAIGEFGGVFFLFLFTVAVLIFLVRFEFFSALSLLPRV